MVRRRKGSDALKWGLIGTGIAAGAALIPLIPVIKRRAMRVTTILTKDHRLVSGLIATLDVTPRLNSIVRDSLFWQIRTGVLVHIQAEEEILYPVMRSLTFMSGESTTDESYREHQEIRGMLDDLAAMDPNTDAFDRKFEDFKFALNHHEDREEHEIFAVVRAGMSREEQELLGRRMHERKMLLRSRMTA
jgi:hemerythrin superfamily protein